MLLNSVYNIGEPIAVFTEATVTVASSTVASDLSDFPLMIDLSHMPTSFWSGVNATGGNIRAYASDGTTLIPHDITHIDVAAKSGRFFVKTDITNASGVVVKIKLESIGTAALAVTDTNGRNAVWADFDVVWVFPSMVNRTGNTYAQTENFTIEPSNPAARLDWAHGDFDRHSANIPSIPTNWTAVSSVYISNAASDYRQGYMSLAVGTNHNNRESLTYDWSPDGLLTWNSSDGRMNWSDNPSRGDTFRAAMTHEGVVARKGYFNGILSTSDIGCANRPTGGTSFDFILNATMTDNNYVGDAYYQFVWLRNEVMSADWLAADNDNFSNPGTFYSVS